MAGRIGEGSVELALDHGPGLVDRGNRSTPDGDFGEVAEDMVDGVAVAQLLGEDVLEAEGAAKAVAVAAVLPGGDVGKRQLDRSAGVG
jgi:hypothetical protein